MNEHQNQSIKDRLKNVARASGKDFNFVSIQFMQERFLARLEKSAFREHLILKGALLLLAYKIPAVRPSKDIDFLGIKTSNKTDDVRSVIRQIARIDLKDGVSFDEEDIDITDITGQSEYPGLRIKIPAMVGGDRHRLQIDIGFGDEVVAGPVDMDYPAILDFPAPNIRVYSLESAIAEKFQAIVNLGIFGSRMKDYYDIWYLIKNHLINKSTLSKALETTFKKRTTPLSDAVYIFSEEFKDSPEKQQQWMAFIRRTGIDANTSFAETIDALETFFKDILPGVGTGPE